MANYLSEEEFEDARSSDHATFSSNFTYSSSDSSDCTTKNDLGMPLHGTLVTNNCDWYIIPILSQSAPAIEFWGKEQILVDPDKLASISKPIDVFKLMISDDILYLLVIETNRYAHEHSTNFIETNRIEMVKFMALVDYMGIVALPEISLYWSRKPLYNLNLPRSIMSRDRFLVLLRYSHVSDNNDANQGRLAKIKPLLDIVLDNFQDLLEPGERIVVDESLVPFRGRLVFRQYIPGKKHKYGIELFKLCTPDGYTLRIIIYAGKNSCPIIKTTENVNLSGQYVVALTQPYLNQGRKVYIDNWYTLIPLAQELLRHSTIYTGTIRSNRKGLPSVETNSKLKTGEVIGLENQYGVQIVKWRSKRDVQTISTDSSHSDILQDTGKLDRTGNPVLKPKSVIDYNKSKQGI